MMRSAPRLAILFFAAAVILANLPTWFSPHLQEEGDLAANALQVERAREFHELLGPYSQHGFHHPGPISFYFFAAAQSVFVFLPSVLARHMLAQFLLNLLWLAGILKMLERSGLKPPLVIVAGFLLAGQMVWLGGGNPLMLANVWGPTIVVFPVVLFVLACTRILDGDLAWLPPGVLAAVVAIHTHLPSLAVLSVAAVLTAALVLIFWRRILWLPDRTRRLALLGTSFLLLVSGIIPPLLEQARTDPGNLSLLFRFFRANGPEIHPWGEVLDKLGQAVTDSLVVLFSWTGIQFHTPATVLGVLALLLGASVLQFRRRDKSWGPVILAVWITLAATVISARTVPGNLHTYLYYYLYPLVGLLQLILVREVHDRWVAPRLAPPWESRLVPALFLAGVLFFVPWIVVNRSTPPPPFTRYSEIVEYFGLEDAPAIHLFVDKAVENDQVWSALPTLALNFRRDGVRVTVPQDYVFICGEEMSPGATISSPTLVITRRVPAGNDDRFLPGPGWGVFLLAPGAGDPAAFLAGLPWGK